jgi:hypothetical protein
MEMQQILEMLIEMKAEQKAYREKVETENKAWLERMETIWQADREETDIKLKELTETVEKPTVE